MTTSHCLSKLIGLLSDLDEALPLLPDNDPMTFAFVEMQFEEIDGCIQDGESSLREHQLYGLVVDAVATARELSKEQRADEARSILLDVTKTLARISATLEAGDTPSGGEMKVRVPRKIARRD